MCLNAVSGTAAMRPDDGARRLSEVKLLLAAYLAEPASVSDEDLLVLRREARAAIDRLDDDPLFDEAHETLDEVGHYIRQTRPHLCLLSEDGTDFKQECPVALGHIRLGFSVGIEIEESRCSICGIDPWQCPHIPGEVYDGQPVGRVITKAKPFEVSLVARPDFPDARITSRPVSRASVEAAFGGALPSDAVPVCDRCITPCSGI